MRLAVLLALSLWLIGCGLAVSNDDRIRETKKCLDAGMVAEVNEFGVIMCFPPLQVCHDDGKGNFTCGKLL